MLDLAGEEIGDGRKADMRVRAHVDRLARPLDAQPRRQEQTVAPARRVTDDDYAHMRKVVGYVHRHLKQGGPKDKEAVEHSPWRLSLMNWGHDPLKS